MCELDYAARHAAVEQRRLNPPTLPHATAEPPGHRQRARHRARTRRADTDAPLAAARARLGARCSSNTRTTRRWAPSSCAAARSMSTLCCSAKPAVRGVDQRHARQPRPVDRALPRARHGLTRHHRRAARQLGREERRDARARRHADRTWRRLPGRPRTCARARRASAACTWCRRFHRDLVRGVATYWVEFFEQVQARRGARADRPGLGHLRPAPRRARTAARTRASSAWCRRTPPPTWIRSRAGRCDRGAGEHAAGRRHGLPRAGRRSAGDDAARGRRRRSRSATTRWPRRCACYFSDTHNVAEGAGAAPLGRRAAAARALRRASASALRVDGRQCRPRGLRARAGALVTARGFDKSRRVAGFALGTRLQA